ncbi:sensor histidine kinase [Vibrio metschnikovii]|nr:sensor histidine kinase [Vibrio metschnikovii]
MYKVMRKNLDVIQINSNRNRCFFMHLRFRNKIFLLLTFLLLIQFLYMAWGFYQALSSSIDDQVRTRALLQAQDIASDPELITLVETKNITEIHKAIERIMHYSDASFIVIGDQNGIRLFHPEPDRIGYPMQGDDNAGALLRKESYTSLREGSLGYGIRGKSPIIDSQGNIIGVVSVGYLLTRFQYWLKDYFRPLIVDALLLISISLLLVWLFSRHIQRKMNNMEPEEISLSWEIQQSILYAVYEGIIAVDLQGRVIVINPAAKRYLPCSLEENINIRDYLNDCSWLDNNSSLIDKQKDEFYRLNHHQIIANREPILHNKNLVGWVLSFREQNDVYAVSASLTQIKQYSDNFRVLRHEFSNKLTTLSGLLKMGKIQEAMILINNESGSKQELLDFIQYSIRVNQVAAFLLGKALRAQELNIDFRLDPTCQLSNNQTKLDDHQLCTVLGNLIENAFDSCRINQTKSPYVGILITDAGQDILIEVSDNGSGLSIQEKEVIWNRGVTRKDDKEDHGLGLYLVDHYVKQAGGFINIDNAEPQGCIFSVFIPNYINN